MIDLSLFCADRGVGRPDLSRPFSRLDWSFATDGHIAVRMPRLPHIPPGSVGIEEVFATVDFSGFLPAVIPQWDATQRDCPLCAVSMRRCSACEEVHCEDCDGPCEACDGNGLQPPGFSVNVHDGIFNAKYIRLIGGLPDLKIPPRYRWPEPLPFVFNGGCGLLMPMSRRDPKWWHVEAPVACLEELPGGAS